MSAELIHALEQIEKEKGISKEVLIDAIEVALITAYKRNYGSANNVEVYIDRLTW
jgi:N utilization substance protein A